MSQTAAVHKPRSALITAEEFERDWDRVRCELVRGEVIELTPPSPFHAMVAGRIKSVLAVFLEAHPLGYVLTGDGGFVVSRGPDTVRGPDIAFLTPERAAPVTLRGFGTFPPDLVVEVVSPGDTQSEVRNQVRDWLDAGTRLVWVVDPQRDTVEISAPGSETVTLRPGDTLTGGDVLPGFSVAVEKLFVRIPGIAEK